MHTRTSAAAQMRQAGKETQAYLHPYLNTSLARLMSDTICPPRAVTSVKRAACEEMARGQRSPSQCDLVVAPAHC